MHRGAINLQQERQQRWPVSVKQVFLYPLTSPPLPREGETTAPYSASRERAGGRPPNKWHPSISAQVPSHPPPPPTGRPLTHGGSRVVSPGPLDGSPSL